MKRETLFLKIVLILMTIPVLAVCIFVVPPLAGFMGEILTEWPFLQYVFLLTAYGSAVAYFTALFQAFRLLGYIDRNTAFSELSVKALKRIKLCAMVITGLYVLSMPAIFMTAELDDAPGLAAMGLMVMFGAIVVAVFAAVLQKLLQNAIEIKSENDLTV